MSDYTVCPSCFGNEAVCACRTKTAPPPPDYEARAREIVEEWCASTGQTVSKEWLWDEERNGLLKLITRALDAERAAGQRWWRTRWENECAEIARLRMAQAELVKHHSPPFPLASCVCQRLVAKTELDA